MLNHPRLDNRLMRDFKKIDKLLQFILLTAGQEDEFVSRWLSPIHLIKYVYLADLAFAKKNDGQTYTELNWKFHHYGPWEYSCFQRIDPALSAIHAEKKIIESKYFEDDRDRWYIRNSQLYDQLYDELPIVVSGTISKYVHKYGSDTSGLLHFIYTTIPMLSAAPSEYLDFSKEILLDSYKPSVEETPACQLTPHQMKKRKKMLREMKVRLREKLDKMKKERTPKPHFQDYIQPRYDEVFFQGLEDLNRMTGEPIKPGTYKAIFPDDVWKSKTRFDPELS